MHSPDDDFDGTPLLFDVVLDDGCTLLAVRTFVEVGRAKSVSSSPPARLGAKTKYICINLTDIYYRDQVRTIEKVNPLKDNLSNYHIMKIPIQCLDQFHTGLFWIM